MSELKQLRKEARVLMMRCGNSVRLIVAGILLIFICIVPLILAYDLCDILLGSGESVSEGVLWLADLLFWAVWPLLSALITLPCLALWYAYSWRLYCQAKAPIPTYLPQKGSLDYGRLLGAGLLIALRPIMLIVLLLIVYGLASYSPWLYFPVMCLGIVLAALLMWGTGGLFLLPYYFVRGETVGRAWHLSRKIMKKNRKYYGMYILTFFGWVLLSILTVGVLLIFYTLPLMIFTYFLLADKLDGKTFEEENPS